MGSYLVRVIPQRGFETRRRSGIVFSVAGTVISEEQMTEAIREDPGLIVTAVADAEAAALRQALTSGESDAGAGEATGDEGQCSYIRANGEQCRGRAKRGTRLCPFHTDDDAGAEAGGATVLTA